MSLIPLDEPRGDSPSESTEGETTDTLFARLWTVVASAVRTLVPGRSGGADTDESPETTPALQPARHRRTDSGRDRSNSRGRNEQPPLELVATETDERLTVADADNPEAKISSDTWERVEP